METIHASAIDEHPGLQDQHHPRAKQRNCSAFTQAKFTCTTRRSSKQRQQQRNSETEKNLNPKKIWIPKSHHSMKHRLVKKGTKHLKTSSLSAFSFFPHINHGHLSRKWLCLNIVQFIPLVLPSFSPPKKMLAIFGVSHGVPHFHTQRMKPPRQVGLLPGLWIVGLLRCLHRLAARVRQFTRKVLTPSIEDNGIPMVDLMAGKSLDFWEVVTGMPACTLRAARGLSTGKKDWHPVFRMYPIKHN